MQVARAAVAADRCCRRRSPRLASMMPLPQARSTRSWRSSRRRETRCRRRRPRPGSTTPLPQTSAACRSPRSRRPRSVLPIVALLAERRRRRCRRSRPTCTSRCSRRRRVAHTCRRRCRAHVVALVHGVPSVSRGRCRRPRPSRRGRRRSAVVRSSRSSRRRRPCCRRRRPRRARRRRRRCRRSRSSGSRRSSRRRSMLLPSSQTSPAIERCRCRSAVELAVGEQPSPAVVLPSSHCSVGDVDDAVAARLEGLAVGGATVAVGRVAVVAGLAWIDLAVAAERCLFRVVAARGGSERADQSQQPDAFHVKPPNSSVLTPLPRSRITTLRPSGVRSQVSVVSDTCRPAHLWPRCGR